jgi:hypothetical protein
LHLALSVEEVAMIQNYAGLLGLCMADAIRLAVKSSLAEMRRRHEAVEPLKQF